MFYYSIGVFFGGLVVLFFMLYKFVESLADVRDSGLEKIVVSVLCLIFLMTLAMLFMMIEKAFERIKQKRKQRFIKMMTEFDRREAEKRR